MITKNKKGVLSVAAVAVLLAVCLSPIFTEETDAAADGTVYLYPGDTYKWDPGYNIDVKRITVTVGIVSTESATPTYAATSTLNGVTATVNSDKTISVAVASGTAVSTVYVKVKAVVTTGVSQTVTSTMTVKVVSPTIVYTALNTYQGATGVSITPKITLNGVPDSVTYSTADSLPDGLKLNSSTGAITGTVSASATAKTYAGTVEGTFKAADNVDHSFSGNYSITVAKSMSLTAPGDQYFAKGTAKTVTLTGTATTSDTAWKITSDAVSGITMSTAKGTSGVISVASTTAAGSYKVDYSATNPTSGQVVTGSVNITVGSVSIDKITSTGGSVESVTQLYSKTGVAATFAVSATSNPAASGLGLTLSLSGNATGITVDGQTVKVASTVAAGTYTFTITETQASTGATASKEVTLIVDPVFEFTKSVTSGSLSVKGAPGA